MIPYTKQHNIGLIIVTFIIIYALYGVSARSYPNHVVYQFTDSIKISKKSSANPWIAVHPTGSRICAVWLEYDNDEVGVYYSESTNGGVSFSQPTMINVDPLGANTLKSSPRVYIDEFDTVYVLWADDRTGHNEIYFTKSMRAIGETEFGPQVKVNDDFGVSEHINPKLSVGIAGSLMGCAAVGCEGIHLAVVWHDDRTGNNDIWFSESKDGGDIFYKNVKVNDDNTTTDQMNPSSVFDSDEQFHIVWSDARSGDFDIYYTRTADYGKTFNGTKRLNIDNTKSIQDNPMISVDTADNIYVVWEDYSNGNSDIYFTRSLDNGDKFELPKKLVGDNYNQIIPSILATSNGTVYVAWFDSHDENIYYVKSIDYGNTFTDPVRITSEPVTAGQYYITIDNKSHIYAIWISENSVKFATSTETPKLITEMSVSSTHVKEGSEFTVKIRVLDKSMQPIESAYIEISTDEGYFDKIVGKTNLNGTYECAIIPKKVGEFNVTIEISHDVLSEIYIVKVSCYKPTIPMVIIGSVVCGLIILVVLLIPKSRKRRKKSKK